MSLPAICQPTLRVNSGASSDGPGGVSACCLAPDWVAVIASCARSAELLKSIFRVTVAPLDSRDWDSLPDVSGHHLLFKDEVQFIPHFPFETDIKYRACFDPRPLGAPRKADPLMLEFLIPSGQKASALTEVTHIFPSSYLLPENLLRFCVCFSNSMQRGRAVEEISLVDSDGRPVDDALYRAPVELWDKTMRRLTVLMDPGRLKRRVGPNVALGPPLKAGDTYTLQIGSGMTDLYGRPQAERFCKHFVAGEPIREQISVNSWKILPPVTGSQHPLVLMFATPLDWALLFQTITIESEDGLVIDGKVEVDQCETRWSFTPTLPWNAGIYRVRVGTSLEDVCGNSITGPFDRPLRMDLNPTAGMIGPSLVFQLI